VEATVEAMQSGEAVAWVSSSNEEAAATASSTGPRIAMGQRGQNIHMLYMQIYPYIKEELHISITLTRRMPFVDVKGGSTPWARGAP
jgi:hypothetical protein